MSTTKRVSYLSVPDSILSGGDTLLYAYDDDMYPTRVVEGLDAAETNCTFLTSIAEADLRQHPVNSYNVLYPYARTAIKIKMDDPAPQEQLAQLVAVAPYIGVRIILTDTVSAKVRPAVVTASVGPQQLFSCALSVFFNYAVQELFAFLDTTLLTLPARLTLDVRDIKGRRRNGWIGLRAGRATAPSGTIL